MASYIESKMVEEAIVRHSFDLRGANMLRQLKPAQQEQVLKNSFEGARDPNAVLVKRCRIRKKSFRIFVFIVVCRVIGRRMPAQPIRLGPAQGILMRTDGQIRQLTLATRVNEHLRFRRLLGKVQAMPNSY